MTTATLLAQLERFLPPSYRASEELLAGFAASFDMAVETVDSLAEASTIGGAEEKWLSLLSRGYGVSRSTGEPDASLRIRLRGVESKLTRPAILDAVNAVLAQYPDPSTGDIRTARIVEWYEPDDGFFLDAHYLDTYRLLGEFHTFYLFVPLLADSYEFDSGCYLDSAYLDSCYLGNGPSEHSEVLSTVYFTIASEVERIRAAGVRWLMIVED